jgi:MFS family permease
MVMMFTGRMLTNFAYTIWQKKTVLQIAGALIFVGFITSSLFIGYSDDMLIQVIITSIGFMFIGLGISCVVPTLYSIVGDKAKTPVGTALTIMSSISFVGPFVSPLLVGAVSDSHGPKWAYLVMSLVGLCIIAAVSLGKSLKK